MGFFSRAQVCGDFAHCGYGTKYPFSANKTRTIRRERHGKWHESLIVVMCFSPRGFFRYVLRRKSSVERERQVNWSTRGDMTLYLEKDKTVG